MTGRGRGKGRRQGRREEELRGEDAIRCYGRPALAARAAVLAYAFCFAVGSAYFWCRPKPPSPALVWVPTLAGPRLVYDERERIDWRALGAPPTRCNARRRTPFYDMTAYGKHDV